MVSSPPKLASRTMQARHGRQPLNRSLSQRDALDHHGLIVKGMARLGTSYRGASLPGGEQAISLVGEPTLHTDVPVRSTAQIAGHPLHPMIVPVPIVCFTGALLTDIAYSVTAEMMWANFSAWMLIVGLVFGVLAAIAGLIDFVSNRLVREQMPAWPHLIGNAVVLVLAFFNALIHTRDAWTSVWPTGLILSILTVLILPVTGWLGWSMVYRHRVGVAR